MCYNNIQQARFRLLYLSYEGLKPVDSQRCTFLRFQLLLYLSYEGLKPSFVKKSSMFPTCCTFPMRDWNCLREAAVGNIACVVVPFLWGIETLTNFLLAILLDSCTFPMRDWNIYFDSNSAMLLWGCTFPMRDWN